VLQQLHQLGAFDTMLIQKRGLPFRLLRSKFDIEGSRKDLLLTLIEYLERKFIAENGNLAKKSQFPSAFQIGEQSVFWSNTTQKQMIELRERIKCKAILNIQGWARNMIWRINLAKYIRVKSDLSEAIESGDIEMLESSISQANCVASATTTTLSMLILKGEENVKHLKSVTLTLNHCWRMLNAPIYQQGKLPLLSFENNT